MLVDRIFRQPLLWLALLALLLTYLVVVCTLSREGTRCKIKAELGRIGNIKRIKIHDTSGANECSFAVIPLRELFQRHFDFSEMPWWATFVAQPRARNSFFAGVVKDSRYADLKSQAPATIYSLFLQTPTGRGQMALYARVAGDSDIALARVRTEVQNVDKDLPMFEVHTLNEEMDAALIQDRLMATLSSFFSSLALVLAGVGLYGLLAFAAVQRTGEVGIRIALGATRGDVVWMVLREALLLVAVGVAIGVPAALASARFATSQIAGLFFGLKATDPAPIALATLILTIVAIVAGYFPARRASRVDPMVALRNN